MELEPIITVTMSPAIDRVIEVERLELGAHVPGRQRLRVAAGKGVNVSRALAIIGLRSVATGFLGRDNLSAYEGLLAERLDPDARARVNLQFFTVAGQTRENVTIFDRSAQVETHVRDRGAEVSERDLFRLKRKLELMCRPRGLVIFSGGLPPRVTPEHLSHMIELCQSCDSKVAVDVSGGALEAVRQQKLFIVKPNRQEFLELLGRRIDTADRAQLISAGRELAGRHEYVLLSLGGEGGLAFHGETVLAGHVPVAHERVAMTVGCGDCLLAGFVAGLAVGKNFAEAYRMALALATANVVAEAPAEVRMRDYEEFLGAADVREERS